MKANFLKLMLGSGEGDLDAFLLTEKGLLLIFQNYVVSGYEDCPIALLIPYAKLSSLAKPGSPLHLRTTDG